MSTHRADLVDMTDITTTRWRIDPARSSVEFHVKAFWGLATVKGGFSRYHGTLDLSGQPAIDLTIEGDSLDTNNKKRDEHLRSPDFFGVERHPHVRFVSEAAALSDGRLVVRGQLAARGASMPLSVEATLRRVGDELEVEAVTVAGHDQLGMTWNKMGLLGTASTLIVKGRLVRDV
jgi:polyisoprenoid-binding protein YceI